jgi:hypothetical protein
VGKNICVRLFSPTTTDRALVLTSANDGTDRVFVAQQGGTIRILQQSTGAFLQNFMTVPNVLNDGEAGLLGLVFHPLYVSNGRFFVVELFLSFSGFVSVSFLWFTHSHSPLTLSFSLSLFLQSITRA